MSQNKHVTKVICSWSGGKDSCLALHYAVRNGVYPMALLNVLTEHGDRSRSHGLRKELLEAQAKVMKLPIEFISTKWEEYEKKYIQHLFYCKENYNIGAVVFGDIDIEPHREWEEKVCQKTGLEPLLPIWLKERKALVLEMIYSGMEAMIVSCNDTLGKSFLGRMIDEKIIQEFEAKEVDTCGENGEFHTVIINCPLFDSSIEIEKGEKYRHNNYWFIDIKLQQ